MSPEFNYGEEFMRKYLMPVVSVFVALCVYGADSPRGKIQFTSSCPEVYAGKVFDVEVKVSELAPVYGVEALFTYDKAFLEVLDADEKKPGAQIEPGNFLDPAQGFAVQNLADARHGTIQYMMTLLNPAPPSKAEGVLFKLRLKALQKGAAQITLKKAKFGNQEGKVFEAETGRAFEIKIADAPEESTEEKSLSGKSKTGMLPKTVLPLLLLLTLLFLFYRKKKKR